MGALAAPSSHPVRPELPGKGKTQWEHTEKSQVSAVLKVTTLHLKQFIA